MSPNCNINQFKVANFTTNLCTSFIEKDLISRKAQSIPLKTIVYDYMSKTFPNMYRRFTL